MISVSRENCYYRIKRGRKGDNMAVSTTQVLEKLELYEGQVLFLQGTGVKSLNILHEGEVEYLLYPFEDIGELSENEIVERGLKLFNFRGYAFLGAPEYILSKPYFFSIRAKSDVVLSVYPTNSTDFSKIVSQRLNIAFLMTRSIWRKLAVIKSQYQKVLDLYRKVKEKKRLLALIFHIIGKENKKANMHNKNVKAIFDKELSSLNTENIPKNLSPDIIKKELVSSLEDINEIVKPDLYSFISSFFEMESGVQKALYQKNQKLLLYAGKFLSEVFQEFVDEVRKLFFKIENELQDIFNDDGMLSTIMEMLNEKMDKDSGNVSLLDFYVGLYNAMNEVLSMYVDVFQREYEGDISVLDDMEIKVSEINSFKEGSVVGEEKEDGSVDVVESEFQVPEELMNSLKQIIEYAELEEREKEIFITEYNTYMKISNKFDIYSDARKHLRRIRDIYWKIYEKSFLKAYRTKKIPKPVELMFYFGYIDENAVSRNTLSFLYNFKDVTKYSYPIFYGWEWLKLIYEQKELPSVNSLGETWEELIRKKKRSMGKKELEEAGGLDTPEKRLSHEIKEAYSELVRLCSGSPITACPILIEEQITTDLKNVMRKATLEKTVKEILKIDFSAFYREVLWMSEDGNRKEFVMVEVIPNFVILPVVGSKAFMWQELGSRDKRSRGRIFVPIIPTADVFDMLLEAVGAFRWELTRTIAGHSWADPTEGILTGDYFDYQSFYKKDKSLSEEVKRKISEEFKKFRDVKARFVNDYKKWIKYESQGIMKLNKRVREIMFKHVPFPREIRNKLKDFSPVYNDLNTRFENLRRKKIRELEIRYRKYQNELGELPEELRGNIEFYKR
jgi:hypothetical protein